MRTKSLRTTGCGRGEGTERAGDFLNLDGPWPSTVFPGARESK
ncbi:MAG TPA: hypothetical protein VGQ77_13170 [Methylomirabilota bacterium]|jgi:hypothetical protein|nr:hypothetical protein [Methylomirabilota bacterium]